MVNVKKREMVVPGQVLAEGMDYLPGDGAYRDDKNVRAKYVGLVNVKNDRVVKVIPMYGKYQPQVGDIIIGSVDRVSYSNWTIETNSPYDGVLPLSEGVRDFVDLAEDDLADYFDVGETVVTKITKVTKGKDVQLSMKDRLCKKLEGGRVVEVPPTKVPRIIGSGGTMVNMIKDATDCTIIVGQNGRIWIQGEKEQLAEKAVRTVAAEAHTSGLTERIAALLEEGE